MLLVMLLHLLWHSLDYADLGKHCSAHVSGARSAVASQVVCAIDETMHKVPLGVA